MNRYLRQIAPVLPLLLAAVTVNAGDSMKGKGNMMKEGMAKETATDTAMQAAPMMEKGGTDPAGMTMEDGKEMDGKKKTDM